MSSTLTRCNMSISESNRSSQQFSLEIKVPNDYSPFIRITLFDLKGNEIISAQNRSVIKTLPKAVYTLRIEVSEQVKDTAVILNEDKKIFINNDLTETPRGYTLIEPPRLFSSVPIRSVESGFIYGSSHEYYTNEAVRLSGQYTSSSSPEASSSLFIMLRYLSKEDYETYRDPAKKFWTDFELEDLSGTFRMIFRHNTGPNISVDENFGFAVLNIGLEPGLYFLNYTDPLHPRQVPVYVYRGWHTQVFLLLGKKPIFRSLRILFSRTRSFDPTFRRYKIIDILLNKLYYNDSTLTKDIINFAANEKFESPMLGMLCAYVYLKSRQTGDDSLFRLMMSNLKNEILDSNDDAPDLRALEILAAEHFGTGSFSTSPIEAPPMFRAGFECIKKMSVKHPTLIPKGSYNDFISVELYYDCPFNTFKPVRDKVAEEKMLRSNRAFRSTKMGKSKTAANMPNLSLQVEVENFFGAKNFAEYISDSPDKTNEEITWVEHDIISLLKKDNKLNASQISEHLNLSAHTITRILEARKIKFK